MIITASRDTDPPCISISKHLVISEKISTHAPICKHIRTLTKTFFLSIGISQRLDRIMYSVTAIIIILIIQRQCPMHRNIGSHYKGTHACGEIMLIIRSV